MIMDPDGRPGLRIETAAGVTARDLVTQHLAAFQWAIRNDRLSAQATVAAYVDGLAGATALAIAGRHGSRDDVIEATIKQLREAISRDLKHLKQT